MADKTRSSSPIGGRHAGADRDRADVHAAIVDVPAVRVFGISAASESGHAPLRRSPGRSAIAQDVGAVSGIRS
jgi:hypothetical protein